MTIMTCWSCLYCVPYGCLQNLDSYRKANAGPKCPFFEYEPGSDEIVNQEEGERNDLAPLADDPKTVRKMKHGHSAYQAEGNHNA